MKYKILLVGLVACSTFVQAMEQEEASWLFLLPRAVQQQIGEYLLHQQEETWLSEHIQKHKQGDVNTPIKLHDQADRLTTFCFNTYFSLLKVIQHKHRRDSHKVIIKNSLDMHSYRRKLSGIGIDIKKSDNEHDKFAISSDKHHRYAVAFYPDYSCHHEYPPDPGDCCIVDVHSQQAAHWLFIQPLIKNYKYILDSTSCLLAVSSQKEIALFDRSHPWYDGIYPRFEYRLFIVNADTLQFTCKTISMMRDFSPEAMDFTPDGLRIAIRGQSGVIKIFKRALDSDTNALQAYCERMKICKRRS